MDTTKLIRDSKTKAILSTNDEGLRGYKMNRERMKKLDTLELDINIIRNELQELKQLILEHLYRG